MKVRDARGSQGLEILRLVLSNDRELLLSILQTLPILTVNTSTSSVQHLNRNDMADSQLLPCDLRCHNTRRNIADVLQRVNRTGKTNISARN